MTEPVIIPCLHISWKKLWGLWSWCRIASIYRIWLVTYFCIPCQTIRREYACSIVFVFFSPLQSKCVPWTGVLPDHWTSKMSILHMRIIVCVTASSCHVVKTTWIQLTTALYMVLIMNVASISMKLVMPFSTLATARQAATALYSLGAKVMHQWNILRVALR